MDNLAGIPFMPKMPACKRRRGVGTLLELISGGVGGGSLAINAFNTNNNSAMNNGNI